MHSKYSRLTLGDGIERLGGRLGAQSTNFTND